MTTYVIPFVLCALLVMQGCAMRGSVVHLTEADEQQEPIFKIEGISEQEAIALANEDAMKKHEPRTAFSALACETGLFWRVIYDGSGLEYVINKQTARIVSVQRVPRSFTGNNDEGGSGKTERISKQEAVSIAMRDVSESARGEDMGKFVAFACELNKVWRVFVEIKLTPGSNSEAPIIPFASTPNYVIDKRSGQVIYKSRN